MERRNFVAALMAGMVLDPERLLWRPKLISIPKPQVLPTAPTLTLRVECAELRVVGISDGWNYLWDDDGNLRMTYKGAGPPQLRVAAFFSH